MRRPHILSPIKGGEMPQAAIWVDTETKQIPQGDKRTLQVLDFGWLAYRRRNSRGAWTRAKWYRFTSPDECWDIVESLLRQRTRTYLFAHNGAFDYPILNMFNLLPERGYKLTRAVIDSPPIILGWRKHSTTLLALDTLNIWRMSLDDVGKSIGIPKLYMPENSTNPDVWDRYCKRDVEIIMEACLKWWEFIDSMDLGGFAPTLAAQALRAYRHRFMDTEIYIDDHAHALELARASYLGGRTECFRIGRIEGPLHLFDVNSMYPHIMASQFMPTRLIATTKRADTSDLGRWLQTRCVTARVMLTTDDPAYPVVHDGRLIFPTGTFEAHLSTPELEYALRHNHIVAILDCAVYERGKIFERFVTFLYGERLKAAATGNTVKAYLIKILLNSLYGKFGQSGRVYDLIGQDENMTPRTWLDYDAVTGEVTKYRSFAGIVQQWREEGESRESHPAVAAHVTAGGRIYLWTLARTAGRQNTYYMDTDSLLTNDTGAAALQSLAHKTALGALKLEGSYPEALIYGPKDYQFGDKCRTKGVRRGALWLSPNTIEQDQFPSLAALLRSGNLASLSTVKVTKRLARQYLKGVVQADGTVSPLHLG